MLAKRVNKRRNNITTSCPILKPVTHARHDPTITLAAKAA